MKNSCKSNYLLLINYSKIVVDWVGDFNCPNNSCSPLIADCKYLLNQLPRVKLKHCYKKTNLCADALVRHRAGPVEWWCKKCGRLRPQVKKRPSNFNQ